MSVFPFFYSQGVNTEVCEQLFSWLSKFSHISKHMNRWRFLFLILYVLDCHNEDVEGTSKNKPTFNNYKLSPETLYLLCPFIAVTLQQKTKTNFANLFSTKAFKTTHSSTVSAIGCCEHERTNYSPLRTRHTTFLSSIFSGY